MIGSNGVIVFPPGYLAGLRALCDAHGIVLIFDEVMTGFGRTGAAFGGERFGVVPDMITFAKGVTSGYVPLGGVLLRERYASAFDQKPLPAGHTYSGHPLAMATGIATLQAYRDGDSTRGARAIEPRLRAGLEARARQARDRRRGARRRRVLRAGVRERPRRRASRSCRGKASRWARCRRCSRA